MSIFFFFNDTATTEIYTLSLHDALPIWGLATRTLTPARPRARTQASAWVVCPSRRSPARSEEHTSELQSRLHLVCRLLLEKKKINSVPDAVSIGTYIRKGEPTSRQPARG